jgi:hypothetical protein
MLLLQPSSSSKISWNQELAGLPKHIFNVLLAIGTLSKVIESGVYVFLNSKYREKKNGVSQNNLMQISMLGVYTYH